MDTARMVLYAGADAVHVPERLFQLLVAFLESNGAAIDRDTLLERVWGDADVTDANLTQHIYLLRQLLEEPRHDRRYVLTVPRRGYRFATAVSCAPDDPSEMEWEATRRGECWLTGGVDLLRHYCRGNYLLDRRTGSALCSAVDAFHAALKIDTECAPALIGLARAWALLAEYAHVPGRTALANARAAIDRALQLDPSSPLGLAVLSELQLFSDWDWIRSKESLDDALTLHEKLALARNNATWYYVFQGDLQRAVTESRQALAAEPSSLLLQLLMARVLLHCGDYGGAIEGMNAILAMAPDYYLARRYRGKALLLIGRPDLALDDLLAGDVDASENAMHRLPFLVRAWADAGDLKRAAIAYEELQVLARREYVSSYFLAIAAAGVGRNDEAIRLLEHALSERDPVLLYLRIQPFFEALTGRYDFNEVLRQIEPRTR
ncbi:MAG TPA: winged helix-turn-helix domain-containing protein [Candidatus Cybelea sp.]|nr:winged helix-turn-helix domain-containing protein [Candidatus Cybelea sp.]